MDLHGIQESLNELGFEKAKQKAILHLIDQKINNDMKEVISEIKRLEDKQDNKFGAMDNRFGAMDSKFGAMDTKFSMIMWALGILIALIVALKFIH